MSIGSSIPDPAQKLRSVKWRLLQSLWILPSILCLGGLTGAGFIYIGVRARRKAWWIPGIVYLVLGIAAFASIGEFDQRSLLSNIAFGVLMTVWLGGVVHALIINRDWLRWSAYYGSAWYGPPPSGYAAPSGYQPPPYAYQPPLPPQVSAMHSDAPQYYGSRPVANVVPLDVNVATTEQLASLPGFDADRAHRTIAQRSSRGGFGSVEEFAAAANLAPHEFAPLRAMVMCQPPARTDDRTPPASGRVVDV